MKKSLKILKGNIKQTWELVNAGSNPKKKEKKNDGCHGIQT